MWKPHTKQYLQEVFTFIKSYGRRQHVDVFSNCKVGRAPTGTPTGSEEYPDVDEQNQQYHFSDLPRLTLQFVLYDHFKMF